jgi:hypothetical protein
VVKRESHREEKRDRDREAMREGHRGEKSEGHRETKGVRCPLVCTLGLPSSVRTRANSFSEALAHRARRESQRGRRYDR